MISRLTDEDLAQPVREGGPDRWQIIQGLIAHTAYHTGQIILMRRLQGAWIVDWRERAKA